MCYMHDQSGATGRPVPGRCMKFSRAVIQWVAAGYLAACCAAPAQSEEISLSRWLPTRIRQLEEERALLLENIAQLPQHDPKPLTDRLGYHALPQEAGAQPQDGSQYIDVQFEYDPQLGAIALVPAFLAVLIGGAGHLTGALLGAAVIGGTDSATAAIWSPVVAQIVVFTMAVIAIRLFPQGLIDRGRR